jgi:hypothetical protein
MYIFKSEFKIGEIEGFSIIKTPEYSHVNGRTSVKLRKGYMLYLPNKRKKLLLENNFDLLNCLKSNLEKSGLKFLGVERKEWNGKKEHYNFD